MWELLQERTSRPTVRRQQSFLKSFGYGCRTRIDLQFGVNTRQVGLHGALRYAEMSSDLFAALSSGNRLQHLLFSFGECH